MDGSSKTENTKQEVCMNKLKSYLTNDDEYTPEALEVLESLSYGITDVAEDTGVDQKLIDELVKDSEFMDAVSDKKKEIKKSMKEGIKFIPHSIAPKKNRWMGSGIKCDLFHVFGAKTKNQCRVALKITLKEIEKAILKELKYCEENKPKK
jgi:hypothetical protein